MSSADADSESTAAVAATAAIPPKDKPSPNAHMRKRGEGLIAGGLAGGFAKTCTAPFERVKILCQAGIAKSPLDAVRTVQTNEGVRGFWKGNLASVVRIIPNRGVLFMCSDVFKDAMRTHANAPLTGLQYVTAGSLSGAVTVLATYPLDLVRGRLTGSLGVGGRYSGIFQTVALTVKEEGFRALYRGMGTSLVGAFPYEGIRFGVYDTLKSHYVTADTPIYYNIACGAVAGLAAATVLYPNDTVRRRMQLQHKKKPELGASAAGHTVYKHGLDCYQQLYKSHGLSIFYRGLSANLARAAPSAALQFGAFDIVKRAFAAQREAAPPQ